MNLRPTHHDESSEHDAVWKLLDQAPPATAGPRFAQDVVRLARLTSQTKPWWQRILAPTPLAGLAAATAAIVFSLAHLNPPATAPDPYANLVNSAQTAEIQDIAETETLITAVDHLDNFSDTELASLIGF